MKGVTNPFLNRRDLMPSRLLTQGCCANAPIRFQLVVFYILRDIASPYLDRLLS
jgi:hypothetical protein